MQGIVHTCENGLAAVAQKLAAFPIVSIQFWVKTGSQDEGEYLGCGLSHLLEHMVFKGSREFNAQQLNEEVSSLGGLWNAYTSTDRTVFHIDGPAEHWRRFLHLLVQLVFHPTFPEEEFGRECDVIRREMAMYEDDPQETSYRALISTLFAVHPRRLPVIGERKLFDSLTHRTMVDYHRRCYVPGNMFACMAGDVDPEEFFAALEQEVADIPASPVPAHSTWEEPRQWGSRLHRREFAQPTSTLMLGWRIPHAEHQDCPALAVLASVLGDGRAAWLYKEFHDQRRLAHDISVAVIPSPEGEGALVVEADVERDDRDKLRDALVDWVSGLASMDFNGGIQRALRQIKTHQLRSFSTVQGYAGMLGIYWHRFRNLHAFEEWHEALHQVTQEDIVLAVKAYLTPERLVEVSVDPIGSNPPTQEEGGNASAKHDPHVLRLSNGLKLILAKDKRVPMAHACLSLGAGCPVESLQTAGINNLLAECILKGTASRTAEQLADDVESLGGSISCTAGNNTLNLSVSGLAEDAGALLELMADAALHPVFPEETVATAKEDMVADILDAAEDPLQAAFRHLRRACFGTLSYGNHPDGTQESVSSLTRDGLMRHYSRLMCAQNAVLCIAGDIDPSQIKTLAEKLFAPMPAGMPAQRTATPAQIPAETHVHLGKQQGVLALALPGLRATDGQLACQILFDGWCRDMAGPIYTEIREKQGLAYYACSSSLYGVDAGCLYFYLGTKPSDLQQARTALESTLDELQKNGMSADALERAKATALATRLMASQSCHALCTLYATDAILGFAPDHLHALAEQIKSVSPEQMNAFIRHCLSSPVRTWCMVD